MKTYTTAQVAKILKIHKNTLLNWLRQGKVKEPKRNGRGFRVWRTEDLNRAIAFSKKLAHLR